MCSVTAAAATTADPTPPVPVKGLIFDDEFNGPVGIQPNHKRWGAKFFKNWSGWTHIADNGLGSVVLTAYKDLRRLAQALVERQDRILRPPLRRGARRSTVRRRHMVGPDLGVGPRLGELPASRTTCPSS